MSLHTKSAIRWAIFLIIVLVCMSILAYNNGFTGVV